MTDNSELSLTKQDLGNLLTVARQNKGLTIEQMASSLRIRRAYLEALEKNDFATLPGMVYAIGFIRTYARALDLNEHDMVAMYKSQNGTLNVKPKYDMRTPKIETRIPGGIPLIIGVAVAVIIFFMWYFLHSEVGTLPSRISEVPQPLAQSSKIDQNPIPQLAPTPLTVVAPSSTGNNNTGNSTAINGQNLVPLVPLTTNNNNNTNNNNSTNNSTQAGLAPAPLAINRGNNQYVNTRDASGNAYENSQALKPLAPVKTEANNDAAQKPNTNNLNNLNANNSNNAATASQKQFNPNGNNGNIQFIEGTKPKLPETKKIEPQSRTNNPSSNAIYGNQGGRIVITAISDSWIEITRKDDKSIVFTRLLKSGESYHPPESAAGLLMSTGNAGGLSVMVDSNSVPVLGAAGVVRHDIDLSPDKLISGTAVPRQTRVVKPKPANETAPFPPTP